MNLRNKVASSVRDLDDSKQALSFLTFWVDQRCYALPSEDVAEVMHVPAMARVPQGPQALLGVANLRGGVLPVVSLRRLLALDDVLSSAEGRTIVLDVGRPVAVVVDSVDALASVAQDRIQMKGIDLSAKVRDVTLGSFETGTDAHVAQILNIRGLLDAAFTERRRTDTRGAQLRTVEPTAASDAFTADVETLITFDVADQEFALALDCVQEIFAAPALRVNMPRSDEVVLGVTSLRGTLLPLLSLRTLLGFPPNASASNREKVVVINVSGACVGLVADNAREVVSADIASIDPLPAVLVARLGGEARIRAIYRGDGGRRLISILAPEQLFREDVMRRLSEQRGGDSPLSVPQQRREDDLNFLVFRLADGEFALPIDAVDEVADVPSQITRVPKTPKFLEGVVNLRGSVLPIVDQRRRFDMAKLTETQRRRLVVVRSDRHRAGLIVDSISDVLRVPANAVEAAPDLTVEIARLVRGVINLEQTGRIVLLLDPSELLTQAERGLLDKFQADAGRAHA